MRGLIVLVLVIGGWLGWIVRNARIQRETVAAISNSGGSVSYDWKSNEANDVILEGEVWAPQWLVDLIGIDFVGQVTAVGLLRPATAPDKTIEQLASLTQIQRLDLHESSVSDAGLCI